MRARFFWLFLICLFVFTNTTVAHAQFSNEEEFLEPEQAFQFDAFVNDKTGHVDLIWRSAPGYHLYREKTSVTVSPTTVAIDNLELPGGHWVEDPAFGRMQVWDGDVQVSAPLVFLGHPPKEIVVTGRFQGCADAGVCYPPMEKAITVSLANLSPIVGKAAAEPPSLPPAVQKGGASQSSIATVAEPVAMNETDQFVGVFGGGLLATLGIFFLAGLGLSLTPCVFPMIPILSAIIVGQGAQAGARGGILAVAYVLGMALTYAVAGMVAGVTGAYMQAFFQSAVVLTAFSLVFVALALSMFGLYELQMPQSVQTRLSGMGKGGNFIGAFIMGALSALIVGPCVAAPLAGALLYISQTGDVMFGGISLFVLGLGMGVPLLAIGFGGSKLLPRAGGWMDGIKVFFGIALLGTAIWLVSRVLPDGVTLALWAVLLVVTGVYLRALDPLPTDASGMERLLKGVGVLAVIYGTLLGIGAVSGAKSVLQPLASLQAGSVGSGAAGQQKPGMAMRPVSSLQEWQQVLEESKGKPVFLGFSAEWCVECQHLKRETFADSAVHQALSRFVMVHVDVTENSPEQRELLKHFQLVGPPALLFFDQNGQEKRGLRVQGFIDASGFIAKTEQVR